MYIRGTPAKSDGFSFAMDSSTMWMSRGFGTGISFNPFRIARLAATIPNEWKNGSTPRIASLPSSIDANQARA